MGILLLYSVTLLLSALLLFWVQPLVAKELLPALGGTPAVWNTCVLFFQSLLLAGYAYALLSARKLNLRGQIILHLSLLAVAALFLPITLQNRSLAAFDFDSNPVPWLLGVLVASVGLPFLVLSASAPLLQRWFAGTTHTSARDPYFLYAASNVGSLLALLLFPFALEPVFNLNTQSRLWTGGYAALALLTGVCALVALRTRAQKANAISQAAAIAEDEEKIALGWSERLRWLALAAIPSSLVLGLTTFITTDIASVPLLWTLPLALYLLTFVLAFANRQFISLDWLARITAGAAILATLVLLSGATEPTWFLVLVHLVFFFFAALTLHTRLAATRPRPARLAEYYLYLAAGGALGGAFNALVAPIVFNTTLEYPLAIILACLLLPLHGGKSGTDTNEAASSTQPDRVRLKQDVMWAASLAALTAILSVIVMQVQLGTLERIAVALGVPLLILNHRFTSNAHRFALGLAAVMLASSLLTLDAGTTLYTERSFYGTLRVTRDAETGAHKLYHGSTLHGRQFTDDARRCEPLSYYHREGPLGNVFNAFNYDAKQSSAHIAVIGLGTGATAAYALPNQTWTFYELNPAVLTLARDKRFFSYLDSCAAAPINVVLGDARLRLRDADDKSYNLIVLDAFSSDAVPIHLLTREAMDLYLAKLASDGWLALHVSNRTLNLHTVVSRLAHDIGLQAFFLDDSRYDPQRGREPSQWIVLSRQAADLTTLAEDKRWRTLPLNENAPLWRDDFSSIVSVFKLFR